MVAEATYGKAAVLTAFTRNLELHDVKLVEPDQGEVLLKILVAGVCGSDVEIAKGKDARVPLPIILGHEFIGEVVAAGGPVADVDGAFLQAGDIVACDRGITCGQCYYCARKKEPSLCIHRQVYGISIGCGEPPYLRGGYAQYIYLMKGTRIVKLPQGAPLEPMVSACCSGATAAHTMQLVGVSEGDVVVVEGPGSVGIYCAAFAALAGASHVVMTSTGRHPQKLEVARKFGVTEMLTIANTSAKERYDYVMDVSDGRGADVVIDTTGAKQAIYEGLRYIGRGGVYACPGIATDVGQTPINFFQDVAQKNARIQGVWVSDTSHLRQAVDLVASGRFPFEDIVTHRYLLHEVNKALQVTRDEVPVKAIILPHAQSL